MTAREEGSSPYDSWTNRTLKIVCGVLVLIVAAQTAFMLAGIPLYYQRIITGTVPTLMLGGETMMSNELVAQWAAERRMSMQTYAIYSIALNLIITTGFTCVAALILWKARRDWFHWFTALVLLFIPSGGLWEFTMVSRVGYHFVALGGLLWPTYLLFMHLFPNGRAVPRWTLWIIGPLVLLHLFVQGVGLLAEWGLVTGPVIQLIYQLFSVVLLAFPLILICQIYRYLRVSTPGERAQTRWFVVGLALFLLVSALIEWLAGINTATSGLTETGLGGDLIDLMLLVVPASIGIGILRYRLYDIDLIIRRTLVYGLLTATLALLYFGGVIGFQLLFSGLAGAPENSSAAVVLSTLAIAALFHPLRSRIQGFIDRRFFRRRYDAERTLQEFAVIVRNEVDMASLNSRLLLVIEDTLQPTQAALWMRAKTDEGQTTDSKHELPGSSSRWR